jgi:hypothetical protein
MKYEENDPETLQLQDELNTEWVKQWNKATKKKNAHQIDLTIGIIVTKKEGQRNSKLRIR